MSIYAMFVQSKSLRVHLKFVANATNERDNNAIEIFSKYQNFDNVFIEKQTNFLTFHQNVNHVIKLKKNKSLYESLYNLFVKKLKNLRKYIDFALKKNEFVILSIRSMRSFFSCQRKTIN